MNHSKFTHIDLFSGIAGFAKAARDVWGDAYENVLFCDNNKFCQEVIRKNFGNGSVIVDDIRKVTKGWLIANTEGRRRNNGFAKNVGQATSQVNSFGDAVDVREFTPKPRKQEPRGIPSSGRETVSTTGEGGEFQIDLLTGGFPCQPFSQAGKRGGKSDDRYLWPEMLRIIKEFRPRWIIGENVAGLGTMAQQRGDAPLESQTDNEDGQDYDTLADGVLCEIIDSIEQIGYTVQAFVIPACAVGAPHRRDRIWIVAHAVNGGLQERRGKDSKQMEGSNEKGQTPRQFCAKVKESNSVYTPHAGDKGLQGRERRTVTHGATPERSRNPHWSENWLEVATRLCRVDDGVSTRVDYPAKGVRGGYRKIPGGQKGWELITEAKHREERLKALGNAIVPAVVSEIMQAIKRVEEI